MILDTQERPLQSLRISVTDRCNLRCAYCMPEESYTWLPRDEILSFEEISLLVDAFTSLGVDRIRITGGEPLLRKHLPRLVELLAGKPGVRDLALTTNGILLANFAKPLRDAGLHRLTVSLDTLRRERFKRLTRLDKLDAVLDGLHAALDTGFDSVKLNTVLMRGVNDDELTDIIEFAQRRGIEPRFIEYMDVGGATGWRSGNVVSRGEILSRLLGAYESVEPADAAPAAPAERFRLANGVIVGVIASTTAPFCGSCDRARLTADGSLLLCLYAMSGLNLKTPLRAGADVDVLAGLVRRAWEARPDRGAEQRLAATQRGPFVPRTMLEKNSHLEMHTRGG